MEDNPYLAPQNDSNFEETPQELVSRAEPRGLGGWLLLIGLGVALSPFTLFRDLYTTYLPVFSDGTWSDTSNPDSLNFVPYFATTFLLEFGTVVALFILSIVLAYLFFTQSYLFPRVYIGMMLAYPANLVFTYWLRTWSYPELSIFDDGNIGQVSIACLRLLILIPYILLSKRVRNTFVAGLPEEA
jgi:hypothetical protein